MIEFEKKIDTEIAFKQFAFEEAVRSSHRLTAAWEAYGMSAADSAMYAIDPMSFY